MIDRVSLEALMQTAHLAAWRAGQIIRADYGRPHNVRQKTGPRDLVTDTDQRVQATVIDVIHERHPDHRFLAEESPDVRPDREGVWPIPSDVIWVIDPLDGTTNFATGLPIMCTSVGAAIDGEPVVGAIYDPLREELFLAGHGLGASLNGRPLPPMPSVSLEEAVVGMDWGHAPHTRERAVAVATALARHCRTLRALGSAALALAYVACGRLQLYCNFGLQPWDVTAAAVLIRETGGELRRPDGSPWRLGEPWAIAGHPALLESAISITGSG